MPMTKMNTYHQLSLAPKGGPTKLHQPLRGTSTARQASRMASAGTNLKRAILSGACVAKTVRCSGTPPLRKQRRYPALWLHDMLT